MDRPDHPRDLCGNVLPLAGRHVVPQCGQGLARKAFHDKVRVVRVPAGRVAVGQQPGRPHLRNRRQYVKLRVARPELKNRVYGRAVEADGRLWLQYWLWYFYNDYSLALGAGLHEGDWEMVQFRMNGDQPDIAVYAQHSHAEKRRWPDVAQPCIWSSCCVRCRRV